jgi:hypothetical protein
VSKNSLFSAKSAQSSFAGATADKSASKNFVPFVPFSGYANLPIGMAAPSAVSFGFTPPTTTFEGRQDRSAVKLRKLLTCKKPPAVLELTKKRAQAHKA